MTTTVVVVARNRAAFEVAHRAQEIVDAARRQQASRRDPLRRADLASSRR
jgi:hypothetical protein